MYKIVSTNIETGAVLEREFDTAEDAKVYRQYHLRFGEWSTGTYWTEEKKVTAELRPFIVDEKTDVTPKGVVRFYQICCKWKIKEEIVTDGEVLGSWMVFRNDRNVILKSTDWTQISDVSMTTAERGEWKKYRQYLRDCPKLHTDLTIASAKVASFEEWKNGAR
jgi:hypothetical protein